MPDKDPTTKRFRPLHAWLEMAYFYFWSNPLVRIAMPKLIELSHQLDATINLAELSGDHVLYVSRVPGRSSQFSSTIVRRRLPALSSAAGRAIISTMPRAERAHMIESWTLEPETPHTTIDRTLVAESIDEAERLGFALTQNQLMLNQTEISAPVRGPSGVAQASIQCSVSSGLWSKDRIQDEILPHIIEAANGIAPNVRDGGL